jgi:hypothetical protein
VRFKLSHEEVWDWDGADTCARLWVGAHSHIGGRLDGDLTDLELLASEVHRSPRKTGGFTPAQSSATSYRDDCPMVQGSDRKQLPEEDFTADRFGERTSLVCARRCHALSWIDRDEPGSHRGLEDGAQGAEAFAHCGGCKGLAKDARINYMDVIWVV